MQRWKDYADAGRPSHLTCRTGQKDRRGHLWEGPWAMPILDLIGAKIKFYDTLPAPYVGKVKAGKQTYDWASWAEILEPNAGTTVVATYADQFYAGKPAAVTRKLGKGTVTYIGVDSTNGDLEAQLIREVFSAPACPWKISPTVFWWTGATVSGWRRTSPKRTSTPRSRRTQKF